jgi:hypothetical protein
MPRQQRARRTSTRSGRPFAWRLLSGLALIVAILVGVRVLVDHSDDIAKAMIPEMPLAGSAAPHAHHPHDLGASARVPAATNRPPLRVTAGQARTVHRIGTSPYLAAGNRFFGVKITIVNVGKRAWVSQPGTAYQVTGSTGLARTGGSAIQIREGPMLPDTFRLAPTRRVSGYVVFQVPADEPITHVSMTVGPGKPKTVSWRIDRQ